MRGVTVRPGADLRRYAAIADVQRLVAATFGVPLSDLRSPRKGSRSARPRMVAMWVCSRLTVCSLSEIGRAFARHHTTVINAVRRVPMLMAADSDFAEVARAAEALCIAESSPDA